LEFILTLRCSFEEDAYGQWGIVVPKTLAGTDIGRHCSFGGNVVRYFVGQSLWQRSRIQASKTTLTKELALLLAPLS
jgi:hypothetical protein